MSKSALSEQMIEHGRYLARARGAHVDSPPVQIASAQGLHYALIDFLEDLDVDVICVGNGGPIVSPVGDLGISLELV